VAKKPEFTYYFDVPVDKYHFKKGVYSYTSDREGMFWKSPTSELLQHSQTVWRQGPHGGVKIMKSKTHQVYVYITKHEELMKQFMWAKLQAQHLV
jgi:hypothetical protein